VDALRLVDDADPDLLVTDIDLGSRPNGVELATIVRERAPHVAVMFLSNLSREAAAAQARDTVEGASFVNKGAIGSVAELVDAAEAVLADRPVEHLTGATGSQGALLRLSPAQRETTRLLAAGLTNAEIARRRGVSVRAVEKSVERVFQALGLGGDDGIAPRVAAATLYTATFGDPGSGL
jgi:DNA-binding NarL/FixJ family response regulator